MTLKEYENNIITKQENDRITNYLKNIIQRYFEIENEISQESKETIIIQAYTRLKEILNAYTNKYIICVNERSGNVDLFIRDLNGEEAFDKNTAFNKDFCDVTTESVTLWNDETENYSNYGEEQEDHIVVGDDDRLSNARIPLAHIHTIDEINGLRERLEEYNLINGGFHLHENSNVLNALLYTGSRISIDLILIEDLVAKVEESLKRFKETNEYFTSIGRRYINQLQNIFEPIYNRLTYINNNIDSWLSSLKRDPNTYTDIKNASFKNYVHSILKNYLSKEEYNLIKNTLKSSIHIIDSGTISTDNINFTQDYINSVNTSTTNGSYRNNSFKIKEGYTQIALSCKCNKKITGDILQNFKNNKIINGDTRIFFEYDKDNKHYRDTLPHVYSINDSQHDFVYADYEIDEENNINVYFKRMSYLPVYLYYPMTLCACVEDNANKKAFACLQLDNTNTTEVSNRNIQNHDYNNIVNDDTTVSFKINKNIIPINTKYIHDLQTVTAEYGAGGLGEGQVPGSGNRTGAYKEILVFTARENYTGKFTLTMNTGHFYGFYIWESADYGVTYTKIKENCNTSNATHGSSPLTITINDADFTDGYTYRIVTQECPAGGTTPENFIYSFDTDRNFAVSVMEKSEADCDVTFSAHKNNSVGELSWIVTTHYSDIASAVVGTEYPFIYKIIKAPNNIIECGSNTSYNDTQLDTKNPKEPNIVGKCIDKNDSEETYEFTIETSDIDETVSYKLEIYANENDLLNSGLLATTDFITISSYSDVKDIYYNIVNTPNNLTNNEIYTIVSDTNISQYSKKVIIKKNITPYFNDKIIFCDNISKHKGLYNNLTEYLSQFNSSLAFIDENNKLYCQSIMLFQYVYFNTLQYHILNEANKYLTNDSDDIIQSNDIKECYYGEFLYGSLNSLFNNATISYELLAVPGKGENNA